MTPTPTGLDGLVGTVAIVLWYFGPALARDALDHRDRTRHRTHRRKDRGPGITRARPSDPAPIRRAEATGRTRRPGRPGGTVLIHRIGPGPGGLAPPGSGI